MFRRVQPVSHKEEVNFPVDMKKLGQDQIRQIEDPDEGFKYFIHKIERINERHREAMDECIRRILDKRFAAEGLSKHHLPLGSDIKKDRCLPILVSNDIETAEKVLVIIGNTVDDLGVWSVREMEGPGINHGSMVSTVKTAKAAGYSVLILNCGQLIYSPELGRAATYQSWKCSTKKSPYIDEVINRVPGHENVERHVRTTLELVKGKLLGGNGKAGKKIHMLTYGWGCWGLMRYLNDKFDEWKPSLEAIIAVESTHSPNDITNRGLENFLRTRTRAYIVHSEPAGNFVPDKRFICQTFSSNQLYSECIIPNIWESVMLPWLKRVEEDPEGCNPYISVDWTEIEKIERGAIWEASKKDEGEKEGEEGGGVGGEEWRKRQDTEEPEFASGMGGLEQIVDLRNENRTPDDEVMDLSHLGEERKEGGMGKVAPSA
ncbi:hypothetical protein ABW19_dt0202266 [Dactylella cylindrospora]|nr:hypothetical protein ABW19_dt0202266 [Dactylella cylindrospora]